MKFLPNYPQNLARDSAKNAKNMPDSAIFMRFVESSAPHALIKTAKITINKIFITHAPLAKFQHFNKKYIFTISNLRLCCIKSRFYFKTTGGKCKIQFRRI